MHRIAILVAAFALLSSSSVFAQDDVADVPNVECSIDGNDQQRYFLIGAVPGAEAPEGGYRLLVVLPGGDGSAEFNPFIRRIWKNALPDGYLVAQLVAVPADDPNQIVWPTGKSPHPKQDFTTEQFIANVVGDIRANHPIDEARVYALGWSSGGPAVYASALAPDSPLRGAFVAMSVFIPVRLPPLTGAKDRRFYLLQSPQDQVTRIQFARSAQTQLSRAGATVKLEEYAGGHSWRGDVFEQIRDGMAWLASASE